VDSLLVLGGALVVLLDVSPVDRLDPGPSSRCPSDMRLVAGDHFDEAQHLCTDPRTSDHTFAGKTKKVTRCYEYLPGVSALEGARTRVETCMDRFEAPNQRGAKPLTMQSFRMAEKWCAKKGKRVCTEQEWELACEGPQQRPFVYGWKVDTTVCNNGKGWRAFDAQKLVAKGDVAQKEVDRLWQGALSGHYVACVSPFGIHDLNGNLEEWVSTRPSRKLPGALMGGFWSKAWTGCRGTNDAHEPTFVFYETGFRCCRDARPEGSFDHQKPTSDDVDVKRPAGEVSPKRAPKAPPPPTKSKPKKKKGS
jgi:sulfatase modifying factor 1